ncbi:hypothetical protein ACFL28_01960 [Candidatus Omnitrophota bacterium]
MRIKNLAKREKGILLLTIALGAGALFYNLIIEPVIVRWRTLDEEIHSRSALLAKDARLLKAYSSLEEKYAKYNDVLESNQDEEEPLTNALGEIESISKKSSCRIVNIKSRASKELDGYREMSFDVIAEGNIDEFLRFLYEIETSKETLRIRRFTITSKSDRSGKLKGIFLISKIIIN